MGGTSTVVTEVVHNLSKDIEICVIAPRKRREKYLQNHLDDNIRVIYQPIGHIPGIPGSHQIVELARLVLRLNRLRYSPNLLWINSAPGFLAYRLSKFRRIPSVVTIHGVWGAYYEEEVLTRGPSPIIELMSRQTEQWQRVEFSRASFITTYSTYLKSLIKERTPEAKVRVIPNGVNADIFRPLNLQREKSILYVGRMAKIKGIHILIQSMKYVTEKAPDWRLWLAGGAFDQSKEFFEGFMTPTTRERIEFLGRIPYQEVPDLINRASIFVMPTVRDGFEIALMEAMATGIPCITTASYERNELYGGFAEMIPPRNPKALGDKILEIINNYKAFNSEKVKDHRIQRARQFDWKLIAAKYEELFRKIAE